MVADGERALPILKEVNAQKPDGKDLQTCPDKPCQIEAFFEIS